MKPPVLLVVDHWDKGNQTKNWQKHRVSATEAEQVFFNEPLVVKKDPGHSKHEERFHALGRTSKDKYLFIAFTTRHLKIRVISARPMDKQEKQYYQSIRLN